MGVGGIDDDAGFGQWHRQWAAAAVGQGQAAGAVYIHHTLPVWGGGAVGWEAARACTLQGDREQRRFCGCFPQLPTLPLCERQPRGMSSIPHPSLPGDSFTASQTTTALCVAAATAAGLQHFHLAHLSLDPRRCLSHRRRLLTGYRVGAVPGGGVSWCLPSLSCTLHYCATKTNPPTQSR